MVAPECQRASPFLRVSLSLRTSVPECISRGTPACRSRSSRPGRSRAPASPSLILVPGGVRHARVPACLSPVRPSGGLPVFSLPLPSLAPPGLFRLWEALPGASVRRPAVWTGQVSGARSPPRGFRAAAGSVDRSGPRRQKPLSPRAALRLRSDWGPVGPWAPNPPTGQRERGGRPSGCDFRSTEAPGPRSAGEWGQRCPVLSTGNRGWGAAGGDGVSRRGWM